MIQSRHDDQSKPQTHAAATSAVAAEGQSARQRTPAPQGKGSYRRGLAAPSRDGGRRWRNLLDSIDQGFCIFEMLYDAAGEPVDYRFLEVNPTFERHTGLRDAVGKTARELVPGLEMDWVKIYAQVAAGTEPMRFEQGSAAMGRWFEVEAVPVGGPARREVALLFTDVTARKLADADAHFTRAVNEQIRAATHGDTLLWTVTEMLGQHLRVARCCFIEVDEAADRWVIHRDYRDTAALPSAAGARAISTYPDDLVAAVRAGRVVAIADTAGDPQTAAHDEKGFRPLGARAVICVPLLREGAWVAAFAAFAAEPRDWSQREVALLETVVGQAWNAVEQLRALESLIASQASLTLALEAGKAGTFEWDMHRNVCRWSPQLEALYGVPPGTFGPTYEAWATHVTPEDARFVEMGIKATLRDRREEYAYEFQAVLPDQSRRWLAGRARFTYGPDGAPLRMHGITIDIDERKRSEEAVRRANQRLTFALDRLDGFLYDYDLDTGQAERSEGFARVLGYAPEEVPPHRDWWGQQIHPDDYARAVAQGRAAQDGNAAGYSLEYRVRHRDGHYLTMWDRGQIERDAAGRARRVLGTTINITERKQGEAERTALLAQVQEALQTTSEALARAEEATRERDLLISIAAHDLRTPLTAILGQAQLMHRRAATAGLDARDQRALNTIVEQSERLNRMIGALLDLSRIQEGRLTIEPQPTDLVAMLERVVGEVRLTATAHEVALRAPPAPLTLAADPLRLEQVLHNLLGNAVKYSPDGGPIEVAVEREADAVRISVHDRGIGIPAAALPHLFTRFYRAPNAAAQASSSMGVGLYVVRELVQAHGGTIAVHSVEGEGSTFVVRLPLTL